MIRSSSTVLIIVSLACSIFDHQRSLADAAVDRTTTVGQQLDTTKNNDDVTWTNGNLATSSREREHINRTRPREVDGSEDSPLSTSPSLYEYALDEPSVTGIESGVSESPDADYVYIDTLWQYQHGRAIMCYGLPILLALTTIDNGLAVVVLQHSAFRGSPTGFILSALAVADTLVVYTGLLRLWVVNYFYLDFRSMSDGSCKFHLVVTYFSRQLSAWTLVLLTVERFIAVRFPFQCKRLITLRRVVIAWCSIIVVLFGANCHFFGTAGVLTVRETPVCNVLDDYVYFFRQQWYLIDAFLSDLVPFAIIFAGNIAILVVIAVGKRRRSTILRCNSTGTDRLSKANRVTSMTVTLMIVSIVFITLNVPSDIYFIGFANTVPDSAELAANMTLFYAVVIFLVYFSNSINFLMYFISGHKFRLATLDVIRCRCFRQRPIDTKSLRVGELYSPRSSIATIAARNSVLSGISVSPKVSSSSEFSTSSSSSFNTSYVEYDVYQCD